MKKRRLISVMLATMMGTSIGVISGCSNEDVNKDRELYYADNMQIDDVYIVLEDNGEKKVHKGDYQIACYLDPKRYGFTSSGFVKLDLDCGKNYFTNADCYIYEKKPARDDYDKMCEDCFSLK